MLKPGALTTIQDGGRWGFQRYGVPVSGPMDPEAFRIANRLVGNPLDAPALEMTVLGGTFEAEGPLWLAACGAPMHATVDGAVVPMWRTFRMQAGQVLRLGPASAGARTYMAVAGGLRVPRVMGSASTYLKGGFGGLGGRALVAGDRLEVAFSGEPGEAEWPEVPIYESHVELRVVLGPEADRFSPGEFHHATFTVTPQADRTGYRLSGPAILQSAPADLLSEAVPIGTIQVPSDGQPILLMADRQPTGGYARRAVVIGADLPRAGQLRPGHTVSFVPVSLEEARRLSLEWERRFHH